MRKERRTQIHWWIWQVIALAFLLLFRAYVMPPLDETELYWDFQNQASGHQTVLGLLVAITAVFLSYFVFESFKKDRGDFDELAKLAGFMLSMAIACFLLAAFVCAMLTGMVGNLSTTVSPKVMPYVLMLAVYILYYWGLLLLLMGVLFGAHHLIPLKSDASPMNCTIVVLVAWIGLLSVNRHVANILAMSTLPARDGFFCAGGALVLLHLAVLQIPTRFLQHRFFGRLLSASVCVVPVTVLLIDIRYLNMRALSEYSKLPSDVWPWFRVDWLFCVFYIAAGLCVAAIMGTYGRLAELFPRGAGDNAGLQCGARTTSGHPCRNRVPGEGQRCRLHGG